MRAENYRFRCSLIVQEVGGNRSKLNQRRAAIGPELRKRGGLPDITRNDGSESGESHFDETAALK